MPLIFTSKHTQIMTYIYNDAAPVFSKHFLRQLPDRQGFSFVCYEPSCELYLFQRQPDPFIYSFETCYVNHQDIMDGSYKYFFQHSLTREA